MNTRLRRSLLLSLVLGSLAWAAPAAPSPWTAERSAQMRRQVDDLLGSRRRPAALPADPPNPFSGVAGGIVLPTPGERARPILPASARPGEESAETLARAASRLRIGGIIRMRDYVQIVINDTPWREGESILVEREPRPVRVQIVRIQPGQLTLRLDDAEMTLRF